jgi:hypothetical protein
MFMGPAYATPDQWSDLLATGSFANLVGGIQAVVDAGAMPEPDDVVTAALHVWANIHGLTSLLVARPTMPWPELDAFIDEHLWLCMRGQLGPGPGGTG